MILITQQEADIIRAKFPDIIITKTMKNHTSSKRGKRYTPAYKGVLKLLSQMRGTEVRDD